MITAIDDTPTPDVGALSEALGAKKPGDQVQVSLTRGTGTASKITVPVTLGELEA